MLAWMQFVIGLLVLFEVSHSVDPRGNKLGGSGLSDEVWFGVPAILGLVSTGLLWKATTGVRSTAWQVVIVVGHLLFGFVFYMVATVNYLLHCGGTL
ncbi:MAG: hypothetical protein IT428_22555 [Planctomycetaceae bacterium]|nr:hypothetical protein [Planctomycetaceae bacterium]